MANKTQACPFGKPPYGNKASAAAASPLGEAEHCGRCKQWHPVTTHKKGRRK